MNFPIEALTRWHRNSFAYFSGLKDRIDKLKQQMFSENNVICNESKGQFIESYVRKNWFLIIFNLSNTLNERLLNQTMIIQWNVWNIPISFLCVRETNRSDNWRFYNLSGKRPPWRNSKLLPEIIFSWAWSQHKQTFF